MCKGTFFCGRPIFPGNNPILSTLNLYFCRRIEVAEKYIGFIKKTEINASSPLLNNKQNKYQL